MLYLSYEPSRQKHSHTLTGLQPGTRYYWKVVALGDEGINTESTVQTFRTAD